MKRYPSRAGRSRPRAVGSRIAVAVATAAALTIRPASPRATTVVTQITTSSADDITPVIRNGRIAWTGYAAGVSNVLLYDIASGATTQVTTDGHAQLEAMDGNTIVYADSAGGANFFNVYAYDISSATVRHLDPQNADQESPAISGDRVIWVDDRNLSGPGLIDIFGTTLSAGGDYAVTTALGIQSRPSIGGDIAAWQDDRNAPASPSSIYGFDFSTGQEFAVAIGPGVDAQSPSVNTGRIAFSMATNSGFANIYLYDVASGTTTQVSRCACNETSPKIAGNLIVWEDDRNAASTGIDLYGVDLANIAAGDIAIDTEPGDQIFPDTDGTNVVFSDNRNGNYDVFLISVPRFTFHGFAAPLSNPPTVNAAKAGATVAVKWQLTDATGAFVSDLNAVVGIVYDMVSCAAFDAATSSDVPAVAAGGSGLRYDATANQYVYNWKTPWAAGCYALTVTLGDGSAHQADFKLK